MKTAQLLQTLNDQLSELAALVAPLAEHATLSPRFDRQLFHTRSTLMQAYLAEAQHNFNQLRQAVERQQLPQVVWIAERLAAQIAALRRETATWSLRSWGPRVANVEPLAAPSPAASGV
ncbi:primosomal replication protein N'' [Klebsiella pneumoniae]|uniref:Primosomal replication protein N n=1 Tax=Klebsiella pneumoniae TaxID=573 RepID=A0A377W5L7_KLEPN|nr:primosomal replication protein N'' [Klebsiella pneumoniae]